MSRKEIKIKSLPILEGVKRYRPPRRDIPIDLRLDGNEGPTPSAVLLEEVLRVGPEIVRMYPNASKLEKRIADMVGVTPEKVLVTAGGDDAIERALRAFLAPGREMILPTPTFEMFERYAKFTGCTVLEALWLENEFPLNEILDSISEATSVIVIVTPNSPTGFSAEFADIKKISEAAPNALLLVDLSYIEFADDDLTVKILQLPNALVVRSFSKAWGLAGLRVGWAAGPEDIIEVLAAAGHPYAVSSLSLQLALARLDKHANEVGEYIANVRNERKQLFRLLRSVGAEPKQSQANFVMAVFPDAEKTWMGLQSMGVAVRIFPNRSYLEDCLRITLPGNKADFEKLCNSLRTVLMPKAILFDIDGVLVDVSHSYRRAIKETANMFGVELTSEVISQAKAECNSNNDWELTWRLIKRNGGEATLAQVTRIFEEFYQGMDTRKGFKETEKLLVTREMLERLSTRYKLGIVTGRPFKDAKHFLQSKGIEEIFDTVVSMEDAAPKPSPEPVKLALERLGVEKAWFIGDSPDDIHAARTAGAMPIGVLSSADNPETAEKNLKEAGTAFVLKTLFELEKLTP